MYRKFLQKLSKTKTHNQNAFHVQYVVKVICVVDIYKGTWEVSRVIRMIKIRKLTLTIRDRNFLLKRLWITFNYYGWLDNVFMRLNLDKEIRYFWFLKISDISSKLRIESWYFLIFRVWSSQSRVNLVIE